MAAPQPLIKPPHPIVNWGLPLTNGLVFDAPFWEGAGIYAEEDIAPGFELLGTLTNGPTWKDKLLGKVLTFTDSTNKVSYVSNSLQNSLTAFSVEALVYATGTNAASDARIINKGSDSKRWDISVVGSNKLEFAAVWAAEADWDTTNAFPTNAWTHLVVTYSFSSTSNTPSIYFNGVSQASSNVGSAPSGSPAADTSDLTIGNRVTSLTKGFVGDISYVRMWNRQLTFTEVKLLYENPWRIYKRNQFLAFNSVAAAASTNWLTLMGVGA